MDVQDKQGFDLAKMKYSSGTQGQYGPMQMRTGGTDIESPWLGQLVQNAMWKGALEDAGYAPSDDSVLPPGGIPGVPVAG